MYVHIDNPQRRRNWALKSSNFLGSFLLVVISNPLMARFRSLTKENVAIKMPTEACNNCFSITTFLLLLDLSLPPLFCYFTHTTIIRNIFHHFGFSLKFEINYFYIKSIFEFLWCLKSTYMTTNYFYIQNSKKSCILQC